MRRMDLILWLYDSSSSLLFLLAEGGICFFLLKTCYKTRLTEGSKFVDLDFSWLNIMVFAQFYGIEMEQISRLLV